MPDCTESADRKAMVIHMKKIGILTYYYNNNNYGGLLQAYALTQYLIGKGYDAEQICFIPPRKDNRIFSKITNVDFKTKLRWKLSALKNRVIGILTKIRYKDIFDLIERRNKAFKTFSGFIKHSDRVFDRKSITETNNIYDVFIAGSDQIWNLLWYAPEYFLSFVNKDKIKLSYAASLPQREITAEQKEILKSHLSDFTGISVRESQTVDLLKTIGVQAHWAADPTLLLTKDEWDKVCTPRKVESKYVFCYFLTNNAVERSAAKEFAKNKSLPIVTLPHLSGITSEDLHFGDIRLYDVSPLDFVSLIKYAEYVITDSFHAAVFSNIYKKQYFVFGRKGGEYMNSRINSLLSLFDTAKRFYKVNEPQAAEHMLNSDDIDYSKPQSDFETLRKSSEQFLEVIPRNTDKQKGTYNINEN